MLDKENKNLLSSERFNESSFLPIIVFQSTVFFPQLRYSRCLVKVKIDIVHLIFIMF